MSYAFLQSSPGDKMSCDHFPVLNLASAFSSLPHADMSPSLTPRVSPTSVIAMQRHHSGHPSRERMAKAVMCGNILDTGQGDGGTSVKKAGKNRKRGGPKPRSTQWFDGEYGFCG